MSSSYSERESLQLNPREPAVIGRMKELAMPKGDEQSGTIGRSVGIALRLTTRFVVAGFVIVDLDFEQ